MTPKGPSLGSLVPDLRRRTTVLSKVPTPSSLSVATRTHPASGTGIGWAHLRPSCLADSLETESWALALPSDSCTRKKNV